ncbi:DUF6387 family protein [Burkholderia sp. Tr-20390]|uniref:DUF6387 family protein n=1 Tax=Burkholderia sp. Tr-20390 TaxID=2703904 RepID=UPI001981367C|nr:DUF6387 family protein [Burkholderia sp. Tr-20390]MBN3734927.1 hypothetical protein [Burkholderia sp. Tr-20390]
MKQVIKSVADLPDWYKQRKYRTDLDAAGWYREIQSRVEIRSLARVHGEESDSLSTLPSRHWELYRRAIDWYETPNRTMFDLEHNSYPIDNLGVFEAFYLSESVTDPQLVRARNEYRELMRLWELEHQREDAVVYSRAYEEALRRFVDSEDIQATFIAVDVNEGGNPLLSYGQPLSGYPITVDTQFDDETLVKHFKQWLADKRADEGEKARRPFNDNDFSDWQFYKIRELHDLTVWSGAHGVNIVDRVLAAALWPNASDDFSPIDVLRTTARKKVAAVFQRNVALRLFAQLRLQLGEKFWAQ